MTNAQILASKIAHEKLRRRLWVQCMLNTPSRYVVWRSSYHVDDITFDPIMVLR